MRSFAGGITSLAVLLFIRATGKSAQIPLFVWVTGRDGLSPQRFSGADSRATMVTAACTMVVRCSRSSPTRLSRMFIVAIIGAATRLLRRQTIGLAKTILKKVLALLAISQLGYMLWLCGVGAIRAAIFHVNRARRFSAATVSESAS